MDTAQSRMPANVSTQKLKLDLAQGTLEQYSKSLNLFL